MELPILKESGVVFNEKDHTYFLGDKELQGITSTLVHRAFPHAYDGVTDEKLAERADYGHKVHEMLEFCLNNGLDGDMQEWKMFKMMMEENNMISIRCEYIVTDFERYASPIDLVMMDKEGGIWLVDLKTNYAPPVEKGTCQLSWYKKRFEEMNPELRVAGCAIAWVRNDEKRGLLSKWIPVTPWADEALMLLIECDRNDMPFDIQKTYGNLPAKFAEVEDEVANIEKAVKSLKERQETLKQGLYALMEENNVKSWTGSRVKINRVLPQKKKSLDSKALKAEMPDVYERYLKETESAGSLRITVTD